MGTRAIGRPDPGSFPGAFTASWRAARVRGSFRLASPRQGKADATLGRKWAQDKAEPARTPRTNEATPPVNARAQEVGVKLSGPSGHRR
jgi:hypothetical protein